MKERRPRKLIGGLGGYSLYFKGSRLEGVNVAWTEGLYLVRNEELGGKTGKLGDSTAEAPRFVVVMSRLIEFIFLAFFQQGLAAYAEDVGGL